MNTPFPLKRGGTRAIRGEDVPEGATLAMLPAAVLQRKAAAGAVALLAVALDQHWCTKRPHLEPIAREAVRALVLDAVRSSAGTAGQTGGGAESVLVMDTATVQSVSCVLTMADLTGAGCALLHPLVSGRPAAPPGHGVPLHAVYILNPHSSSTGEWPLILTTKGRMFVLLQLQTSVPVLHTRAVVHCKPWLHPGNLLGCVQRTGSTARTWEATVCISNPVVNIIA